MKLKEPCKWHVEFDTTGNSVDFGYDAAFAALFGFDENEAATYSAVADKWLASIHPDDRGRVETYFAEVAMAQPSGVNRNIEYRLVSSEGCGVYRDYALCQRREDGSLIRMDGTLFEIAAPERFSNDKEKRYDELLCEIAHACRWSFKIGADKRIFAVNCDDVSLKYIDGITYFANDNPLHWLESVHPDDRQRTEEAFMAAIDDTDCETRYEITCRFLFSDGKYHWLHSIGKVFRDRDGTREMLGVSVDVTQQIEVEYELRRNNYFKDFGYTVNAGFWNIEIKDRENIASVFCDNQFRRMLGFQNEDEFPDVLESWTSRLHPDDYERTIAYLKDSIRSEKEGLIYNVCYRIRQKNNEYHWYHAYGKLEKSGNEMRRLYGIIVDISTEQMLDEVLTSNQVLSDVTRMIYTYNNTVDLEDGSFKIISGVGGESVAAAVANAKDYREAFDILLERIRPEYHDKIRRLAGFDFLRINSKKIGVFGSEIYQVKGDYETAAWGDVTVTFGVGANGHPVANILGRDITKSRREAARIEREMKAATAKDQILSGITQTLYGFNITVNLNQNTFKLIKGSGTDRICGVFEFCRDKTYSDAVDLLIAHVPEEYKVLAYETISRDIMLEHGNESGFMGTKNIPWHGSDGSDNWVELNLFMAENAEGEKIANILGRDVTQERKEQERIKELEYRAVQAKIDAAEETSRAKTAFLANMSHDIRTPMNAIIGFSDIARKHINDPKKVDECLDKVQLAGTNLLEIVDDILDMSKIDSQKIEVTEYPAWISRMSNYFATIISTRMKEHGHTFICEAGEYWNDTVWIDKPHLNRIVLNLLSNAVKYTPNGGLIKFNISQLPERKPGYATFKIVIQDNGLGMSEEYQQHLFERFTREHNSTISGIQGTGIGMAITKSLVDLLGGTISVESKENEGSRFTLIFDFRIRAAGEGELEEIDVSSSVDSNQHSGRILLVEDNEVNREIGLEILKGAGFEVEIACNGQEAVEKVKTNNAVAKCASRYNLVLMDIMMPVMNGLDATRAIRKWESDKSNHGNPPVPIVALSANAFTEDRNASLNAGMNDHLPKPIKIKSLLEVINKYI